jgi:DNA modification methylase
MIEKQKLDRYEMHKYWGKKPAFGLVPLINKYSRIGDTLLDPFAGYGVFCSEAYIAGRNVIINDLNPIANFISKNLFEKDINLSKFSKHWSDIKSKFLPFLMDWYSFPSINQSNMPVSILRDRNHRPLKLKYAKGSQKEIILSERQSKEYLAFEHQKIIEDWYPQTPLIPNSRISARKGMIVADLFTKRELACHARLFKLINEYSSGPEHDLLLLAFTANLANCSILVPPINSRGDMSQGAWMTGFYIGETYIENNVLYYFENRIKKVLKGKEDFLTKTSYSFFDKNNSGPTYKITHFDAKKLSGIADESVDYVFTDPPYGDTVPYFEQSIIWNSWLGFKPDYDNEIVVSNSCVREKDVYHFENDMNEVFQEISRVLKKNKYLSLTYHSLSGREWKAITNACILNGFEMTDYEWLTQKTFTPRQLNRTKTVKGDVLITLQKSAMHEQITMISEDLQRVRILEYLHQIIGSESIDTNHILMRVMKWIFTEKFILGNLDVYELLKENFKIDNNGLWKKDKVA